MDNWTISEATRNIFFSKGQKAPLASWWNVSTRYFDNEILVSREFNPNYLITKRFDRWGMDNIIPDAMRAWEAYLLAAPFDIQVGPMGDQSDPIRIRGSQILQEAVDYYRKQPQFRSTLREIGRRMKIYNAVAIHDFWDDAYDRPGSRVVTHNDLFFDPAATAAFNEIDGPRWFAVRRMLTRDVAVGRYGESAVESKMNKGVGEDDRKSIKAEAFAVMSQQYEIYEWFGIDESETTISDKETRMIALSELGQLFDGSLQELDPDVSHEKVIKHGDRFMIEKAVMQTPGQAAQIKTIDDALNRLSELGANTVVDSYSQWRQAHADALEQDGEGGTRPKYPGFVYHAEFQLGKDEPLIGPEAYECPHFQLPLSFFRSHQNAETLWGKGPMCEALALQSQIEWWEKARLDHATISGRPPLVIDEDLLSQEYKGKNREWWLETLQRGFRIIFSRGAQKAGDSSKAISFANPGTFSWDVKTIIDYYRGRIQEIIGPVPVLRGQVGSEASGKQVQIRQESASRPISDTLSIIEAPMQKHIERMVQNILAYGQDEMFYEVSGPDAPQVIDFIRNEIPDFRCFVDVSLGQGIPTDWLSKQQLYMSLGQMGVYPWPFVMEQLRLPKPPPPEMPPAQPGMPPGGQPGQTPPTQPGPGQQMPQNMMQGAQAGA
jgi:hypothetical protein